jgi:hypothetical protein
MIQYKFEIHLPLDANFTRVYIHLSIGLLNIFTYRLYCAPVNIHLTRVHHEQAGQQKDYCT